MASDIFYSASVAPEWLDALNHVNFLEYQRAADRATDNFWIAVGGELAETGRSTFSIVIVEAHVRYLRELRLGDAVDIRIRIIAFDGRRIHIEHTLVRGDVVTCVIQVIGLAFDLATRRASRWPPAMLKEFTRRCDQPQVERVGGLSLA